MRILLIDYNAAIHMHYHIKDTNYEANYLKNIREVIRLFKIDRVFTLLDGGYTYRTSIYPQYKQNRETTRQKWTEAEQESYKNFRKQSFQFAKHTPPLLGMPTLRVQGCEADDIAAYMVKHLNKSEHQILLLSSDKDWHQLLQPGVVQASYTNVMGALQAGTLGPDVWMNKKLFEEKYGLTVEQWIMAKCLAGDSGDNCPNAATKLGEGTATKLLQKYGDIEGIRSNKDNLDVPRMAQVSKDTLNFDTVDLNYKIMNLNHTPEEELQIIGAEGVAQLKGVISTLDQPAKNELHKGVFEELCYERGWIDFLDPQWEVPFLKL